MKVFKKLFISLAVTALCLPSWAAENDGGYNDIKLGSLSKELQQQIQRVNTCSIDKFQPIQVGKSVYVLAKLAPHIKVFHILSGKMEHARQFANLGYIDLMDAGIVGVKMPKTGIDNIFYVMSLDKELEISAPNTTDIDIVLKIYKQFKCN